jgi:hypothetical protein
MKNIKDPIGNRHCALPTCSSVPQPTALPQIPEISNGMVYSRSRQMDLLTTRPLFCSRTFRMAPQIAIVKPSDSANIWNTIFSTISYDGSRWRQRDEAQHEMVNVCRWLQSWTDIKGDVSTSNLRGQSSKPESDHCFLLLGSTTSHWVEENTLEEAMDLSQDRLRVAWVVYNLLSLQ